MESSSREISFSTLNGFFKNGTYIEQVLKDVKKSERAFIQHLCFGVLKNYRALSEYVMSLNRAKARFKRTEKLIAAMGAYQMLFMDSVPTYAAVNEAVNLARKHTHQSFAKKLNAILRQISLESYNRFLDQQDFKTRYSLSDDLEKMLLLHFPKTRLKDILDVYQKEKISFFRLRKGFSKDVLKPYEASIQNFQGPFYRVIDAEVIRHLSLKQEIYFQNPTPYFLFEFLKEGSFEKILDLCSAPGGKLLLAAEEFCDAKLFANDLSEKRLKLVKENFRKYHLSATFSSLNALDFDGSGFDLIILDVPCSNTGVIRKKPEAKLRFSSQGLDELNTLQENLLQKAKELLSPGGKIWYMTCSILPEENQKLIEKICSKTSIRCLKSKTILPTVDGFDGGYAALLEI